MKVFKQKHSWYKPTPKWEVLEALKDRKDFKVANVFFTTDFVDISKFSSHGFVPSARPKFKTSNKWEFIVWVDEGVERYTWYKLASHKYLSYCNDILFKR